MSTVISVENISKAYRLGQIGGGTLREDFTRWCAKLQGKPDPTLKIGQEQHARHIGEQFWALNKVSFEVKEGEVLGIIGRNGAGKSTLLKVLSQVTMPTSGRVKIKGRIASLLEVGTGFHPELTGRENIFLNGAILGMTKSEIRKKFEEIVDFSGVEEFIDTPVKRYSSGMYVRLAFAVAAHLEPEILIVDEVLAVGDAEFQQKCIGKMQNVSRTGRTVLFVSHSMSAVLSLCTSALFMEDGKLIRSGKSEAIVNYYLQRALPQIINGKPLGLRTDRTGNGNLKITGFRIEDGEGQQLNDVVSGMDIFLVLSFETRDGKDYSKVDPGISLHKETGETIFVFYSSYAGKLLEAKGPKGKLRCKLEKLPLTKGRYIIGSRIVVNGEEADWPRDGIGYINVEPGDFYGTGSKGCDGATSFLVDGSWTS